jgi:phage shock protein PspC (stress-responsive transcriptional regulator)
MDGRPSLRRRVDHRMVAGVAGGIADWLNAPVLFIRVLLFLASTYSPWITGAYAAAALLLPARGRDRPGWDNLLGVGRLVALLLIPRVLLGPEVSTADLFRESPDLWIPAFALTLAGYAVVLSRNYPRGPTEAQARATVLGAMPLVLFAAAVALGVALVPDVRWDRAAPFGALLAGALLAVGVRQGRWRALIGPAAVAAIGALGIAAADVPLQGGIGDRRVATTAAGDPPATQRVAVGDLSVDVGRLEPRAEPATIRASVGVGDLTVIVPRGARVDLDARVGRGTLNTIDFESGYDLRARDDDARVPPLGNASRPRAGLHVRVIATVGVGELAIYRTGARGPEL